MLSLRNKLLEKSSEVFNDNIIWLLYSDIRIKDGPRRGAVYGWKNLNPPSYPFIYNEITGYALTSLIYIYSELSQPEALHAAKDSANWLIQNLNESTSFLLPAGIIEADTFVQKGDLSKQIYAFDNGMVIIGLLNIYKITKDRNLLIAAENMAKSLIERFFDGSKLVPVLDNCYNAISRDNVGSVGVKWSTVSGAYHSKLSLCFLELSRLTSNDHYAKVSDSLCRFALKFQQADGRFITNPDQEKITYLHPHLYACEGLICGGIMQSNENYVSAGIKGVIWAMKQVNPLTGGLPRNTAEKSIEQSDCMAQLLRLLILCRSQIQKLTKNFSESVDELIDKLHLRLLDFYITEGVDRGGIRYHLSLDTACSWCTMFTMQALGLWTKRKEFEKKNNNWIECYV
jgi:Glycosyl hydrolase family 47